MIRRNYVMEIQEARSMRSPIEPSERVHEPTALAYAPAARGWLAWVCFLSFAGLLLWLLWTVDSGPDPRLLRFMERFPLADKVGHFFLMGSLSLLLDLALGARELDVLGWRVPRGSLWIASLVTLEELTQIFIPHRTFDLLDLAADFGGILVAAAIVSRWRAHRPLRGPGNATPGPD